MFRRPYMLRANPISTDQLALLVQANQLLSQGKPFEAASLFAQLAQAMQSGNHPRRAANLYARAAHAYVDGNDGPQALACARSALALFTQTRMAGRATVFYANITRKMESHAMQAAVQELQSQYAGLVAAPSAAPRRTHAQLPTDCPKCGAPVHTEDATWVDENTLECEYCGALIRTN